VAAIHPDDVFAALARSSGTTFEAFFKEFMAAVVGDTFMPLGGTHDGGADAFQGMGLYTTSRAETFYQASVQADHRAKIKGTLTRLKEFGRAPKTLVYVTNRIIQSVDRAEEDLTAELGVFIRIRDGAWIANNINKDFQTQAAFRNHLSPLTCGPFGRTDRSVVLEGVENIEACVFLSYEVETHAAKEGLLNAVTDSLILWALEDTDPDSDPPALMDKEAINTKVMKAFPFAKHFLGSSLQHRLDALSTKNGSHAREVRHYRKTGEYCLPFETREEVRSEHNKIEALVYRVREQVRESVAPHLVGDAEGIDADAVVNVIMDTLEATFRNEGLKVALIVSGQEDAPELTAICDYVDEQIIASDFKPETAVVVQQLCIEGLRKLFYESTTEQRSFLQTLSRTYSFLFSMQYEPRVVEYFQGMQSHFNLYVGADIIVRALSETFLRDADRATENMLKILREAGSKLYLTEPTLEEVWTHIIATDTEFAATFAPVESKVDLVVASQAPRILIRSYFYAKLAPVDGKQRFKGWSSYIDQFCVYRSLRTTEGKDSLRGYLCRKYGFKFQDRESVSKEVDRGELEKLKQRFLPLKQREEMALNDALMVLLVYARRKAAGERYNGNPYGFSTWWLTQESRVQHEIKDLVRARGGRCIIRPEFLMYYISMVPRRQDVVTLYKDIFPSMYGVKLGRRVKPELLDGVLSRAKQFMAYDEARVAVELRSFADRLKADQLKRYEMAEHR
jgi:hypothetical protein